MTLSSLFLILRRQFIQKWGRFLLASGGIMVGIWAITLTSSLSLGLSNTVVTAINSQPSTKEFQVYKTSTNQTSFFDITEPPKFVALSLNELNKIKNNYPAIVEISPSETMSFFLLKNTSPAFSCVEELNKQDQNNSNFNLQKADQTTAKLDPKFIEKCPTITITSGVFDSLYQSNKREWFGKTEKPNRGEIVLCYKCGGLELGKTLGYNSPQEMLGKEIVMEFQRSPNTYEAGKVVDISNSSRGGTEITKSVKNTFKISSVIDDRETSGLGGGNANYYLDFSYYLDAAKIANPNITNDNIGFIESNVFLRSYEDLDNVIRNLQNDKYLPLSIAQALISGVKIAFSVLTVVLSGFGFIALIASVFGIVNVMTISVLERRKEIGILKSLGARGRDIFGIFLIESAVLGIIGWVLGTLLALGSGNLIGFVFKQVINGNIEWKKNLDGLNIDSFTPIFPIWLLLGNFILALLFTIVSGVFPALNASKQNPVEVLRSE